MGRSSESGLGALKLLAGTLGSLITFVNAVVSVDPRRHVELGGAAFGCLGFFVLLDVLWWRKHPVVWITGFLTLAAGAYWLVGFAALHGVPVTPLLPEGAYPQAWGYIALFGWMCLMAVWELVDAHRFEYHDEAYLRAGAAMLVLASAIALVFTLRVLGVAIGPLNA